MHIIYIISLWGRQRQIIHNDFIKKNHLFYQAIKKKIVTI